MATGTAVSLQEWTAYVTAEGFTLDGAPVKKAKLPEAEQEQLQALLRLYEEDRFRMLFYFGFQREPKKMHESLRFLHYVSRLFIQHLTKTPEADLDDRERFLPSTEETAAVVERVPYVIGSDHVDAAWVALVFERLSAVFAEEQAASGQGAVDFLSSQDDRLHAMGRIFFHLVERKSEEYPFAFLATYRPEEADASHLPLKHALREYEGRTDGLLRLLSTVSQAAEQSTLISQFVERGELFHPLQLTAAEAYTFLKEIPLYEEAGILCRMPDWWRKRSSTPKLTVKVGEEPPRHLGMEALLSCQPEMHVDGVPMSEEEVRALLQQADGLTMIKGKWVEVDHEKLQATLEAYEKTAALLDGGYTFAEAMRLQLQAGEELEIDEELITLDVTHGEWLDRVRGQLAHPASMTAEETGTDFTAELRPYQQHGFDWLQYMRTLGLGACLADDMGLGKTVQVIALLDKQRQTTPGTRTLLVLPASLMGNWKKEIETFAPSLTYTMITSSKDAVDVADGTDVYMTTYGMAARREDLASVRWDHVILDEAQAIKNPNTKQTKAVKQLQAGWKVALTGTPIENSLRDLWSLFDFLNAGLLGSPAEFKQLTKKLEDGDVSYARLRSVVNPFILRRLKTDKQVISDLPEKIERKTYPALAKQQVVLYKRLVRDLEEKLEDAEGIDRKGLILSSMMKFKQICNHPDHYMGLGEYKPSHSGKFEQLKELCATIYEKRERVLIFTQFKEMVEPVARFLETVFEREGLTLDGSTPVSKRAALVERFNGDAYVPFMVLSLKAGGVGLNLTAANHVIHLDRWWNPAVENQATDRAFRIGQEKNVVVHTFVTAGTIEENIDRMIEDKRRLAEDMLSSSGEAWITELDNDELLNLFQLQETEARR
ncbi:DEAD/DEAH box helicase [Alkalicoccus chagannorensis]|uniref:DEAD/DEAH box helicase n=1 Tax=Alkalicoccus chagannorensis TaxID=427072 RepID=UPI00040B8050|nr:DEAD/DEAH box helicase [Alkalicoccus chagannorensis]